MVDEIEVVVPAHDEATTIDRCLDALEVASRHPRLDGIAVTVLVVLDDCRDDTALRSARPRSMLVRTEAVRFRNVGRSRVPASPPIIRDHVGGPRTLLASATTDADS